MSVNHFIPRILKNDMTVLGNSIFVLFEKQHLENITGRKANANYQFSFDNFLNYILTPQIIHCSATAYS